MKKEIFKNILKINGFIYSGKIYNRDDGIQIECRECFKGYHLVFQDGDVIYIKTKEELIGELALRNIINRLF